MIKKTKTQLGPEFLIKIKESLLTEKNNLVNELKKFAKPKEKDQNDYDAVYPEYGDKEDENAQEVAQYTTDKPLEVALEKSLRDVNSALERIENNTYGICKYCHNLIDQNRLLARPTSSACISCKKALTQEI